jgi:peptidoglycan/LPS O-acetylase OafA/YrhL
VASGYLAVDFFFLLSGLVIDKTYGHRLTDGLTFSRFAAVRAIRVYPLYLIGFALGLVRALGQTVLNRPDHLSVTQLAISAVFEPFLLPSPTRVGLFALDVPAWSLFFELAINVVYALVLVKCSARVLGVVAAMCGALLIYAAVSQGSLNVGQSWATFHGGIARVGFSFTVGVLLARFRRGSAPDRRLALVPMALLVLLLVLPAEGAGRIAYDLFAVLVAAPLLVWFGASYNPMPSLHSVSQTLGALSYPIYAIHYPLLWLVGFAAKKAGLPSAVWIALFFASTIGLAWLLNTYWDVPVRRRLTALLTRAR